MIKLPTCIREVPASNFDQDTNNRVTSLACVCFPQSRQENAEIFSNIHRFLFRNYLYFIFHLSYEVSYGKRWFSETRQVPSITS